MATTLVPLIVGLLGGLGSAVVTQLLANRREDARWHREREREQASWTREDAARSYEHRRAAYVDFIKEFRRLSDTSVSAHIAERWGGLIPRKLQPEDLDPVYDSLGAIAIFGTEEAGRLAGEAYGALVRNVFLGEKIPAGVLGPLQNEIRRDLSIPSLAAGRTVRWKCEG